MAALLVAAVIGTAGCRQATGSSRARTGSITLSIGIGGMPRNTGGATAWTIVPAMEPDPFSRYEVTFTNTTGGAAHAAVETNYSELRSGKKIDGIVTGTYTVTVTAYTAAQGETAVAEGSETGVVVDAGSTAAVNILLGPTTGGANGTLDYEITTQNGITGKLEVYNDETVVFEKTITSSNFTLSGKQSLAAGFYMVRLTLEKDYRKAGLTEVVHIYSGLTSKLAKSYTEDNLTSEKPVLNTDLTNLFAAPKWGEAAERTLTCGEQYTGTIGWSPSLVNSTVFAPETGYRATVMLTANLGWTFKGVGANSFSYTGASVTNEAVTETGAGAGAELMVHIDFPATAPELYDLTVTAEINTIIVEGDLRGIVISNSAPRTFTAKAGFTDIEWYLDGAITPILSANSITIEALDCEPGAHAITVAGTKDGKRYSQMIPFTVVWAPAAAQ